MRNATPLVSVLWSFSWYTLWNVSPVIPLSESPCPSVSLIHSSSLLKSLSANLIQAQQLKVHWKRYTRPFPLSTTKMSGIGQTLQSKCFQLFP